MSRVAFYPMPKDLHDFFEILWPVSVEHLVVLIRGVLALRLGGRCVWHVRPVHIKLSLPAGIAEVHDRDADVMLPTVVAIA